MVWAICIGIWLMIVAAVIAFLYGACGPDTEKEREQDWEDFTKEEKLENNQWFCGKCGWQIGEEDNYCNECGQKVDWS